MKDILIVEDGQQERERLHALFRGAGYSVEACPTVADAQRVLALDTFRLVMLDIGLTDRSGSYLFGLIKRGGRAEHIIIYTGNPSVHIKERLLDEGAVDYIVKGSPAAQNESLLRTVTHYLGAALPKDSGIDLAEFVSRYVSESSRKLFYDADGSFPKCPQCLGQSYRVTFQQQPQLPPEVQGMVICTGCGRSMDPEVG